MIDNPENAGHSVIGMRGARARARHQGRCPPAMLLEKFSVAPEPLGHSIAHPLPTVAALVLVLKRFSTLQLLFTMSESKKTPE